MTRLEGRVAIVTGAAGGIGSATAERLAREGAKVVLADIQEDAGQSAAAALRDKGCAAEFVRCDIGSEADIAATITRAEELFGTPDVLMNNAGIFRAIDFLEMTPDQFDEVIRVNLRSVYLFSQGVARRLVARAMPGAIVNVASVNARMSSPLATAYSASKGGVSGFTAAVSLALAPHGIRVNAIGPGTIETGMSASIHGDPEAHEQTLSRIPLGRLGRPAEIAALAAFLASEDASYLTGQTIFADGGRNALSIIMPKRKA